MLPTLINVYHVTSRPGMILQITHRTNSTHCRTDEEHSTSINTLAGFWKSNLHQPQAEERYQPLATATETW